MTLRAYLIPSEIDASSLPWLFEGERVLKVHNGMVTIDGSIVGYTEVPVTPEPVDPNSDAYRIARLWAAADAYEKEQISGSATALLVIGVMQALPVSLAIKAWIKSIWGEYYVRKANGSTDYDFSFAGPIPHTVPELMTELGE